MVVVLALNIPFYLDRYGKHKAVLHNIADNTSAGVLDTGLHRFAARGKVQEVSGFIVR